MTAYSSILAWIIPIQGVAKESGTTGQLNNSNNTIYIYIYIYISPSHLIPNTKIKANELKIYI